MNLLADLAPPFFNTPKGALNGKKMMINVRVRGALFIIVFFLFIFKVAYNTTQNIFLAMPMLLPCPRIDTKATETHTHSTELGVVPFPNLMPNRPYKSFIEVVASLQLLASSRSKFRKGA